MKIKGKFSADVVGLHVKRNKSHDGGEAFVDVELGVDEEQAVEKFGEDFALLAFSTMKKIDADGSDSPAIAFLVDSVKPGHRVVMEHHTVKIGETKMEAVQPELLNISPVDGKASVVVKLRIGIPTDQPQIIDQFFQHLRECATIKLGFNPAQGELALELPKSNGAHAEGAAAH